MFTREENHRLGIKMDDTTWMSRNVSIATLKLAAIKVGCQGETLIFFFLSWQNRTFTFCTALTQTHCSCSEISLQLLVLTLPLFLSLDFVCFFVQNLKTSQPIKCQGSIIEWRELKRLEHTGLSTSYLGLFECESGVLRESTAKSESEIYKSCSWVESHFDRSWLAPSVNLYCADWPQTEQQAGCTAERRRDVSSIFIR